MLYQNKKAIAENSNQWESYNNKHANAICDAWL